MDKMVTYENNQLMVNEKFLKDWKEFQVLKKEMDEKEKSLKIALVKAMEENNISSYENDFLKVTYIAPTTRVVVDTQSLKDCGLYEQFTKSTDVASSVRITLKKED